MSSSDLSAGFPPIESSGARILILGSLPGQASIDAQQYYAHPRNAFWPIMRGLTGAGGDYGERCQRLASSGIAVWDVLQQSVRPGSLDSSIRMDTATPNDFGPFFERHLELQMIAFNGRKAQDLFNRLVLSELPRTAKTALLPSTSPAHASMTAAAKREVWRGILGPNLKGVIQ
ncbi:MAG: DNA-deoxyinosine glycosylase [Woeseiaceae bacterium]|nr:DNA-deoxyinosine glycosylase [Woeseiaceae bacterium]